MEIDYEPPEGFGDFSKDPALKAAMDYDRHVALCVRICEGVDAEKVAELPGGLTNIIISAIGFFELIEEPQKVKQLWDCLKDGQ